MAIIGDKLIKPEIGFVRYDDTDNNIEYIGNWNNRNNVDVFYNLTSHRSSTLGDKIKFNFTGSKIRIISQLASSYTKNICIKIDNKKYYYSQYISSGNPCQVIVFEKLDLEESEHFVEINLINNSYCDIDAIDISKNNILKKYNENLINYLLEQDNKYYSIKKEYFKNNNYIPLEMVDNITDDDFKKYGFDDLNLLLRDININNETFKPINKLKNINDGKFKILMKKI